ncbi:MAG: cytochrome c [Saprospiraceae bacterium]|nr:cytochrome c [Saprospiraceae bacterium]
MNKICFLALILLASCQDTPYQQGKRLYTANCANCHMDDGSGLSKMIPALSTSTLTYSPEFVCLLYTGKNDTIFEGSSFLVKEMPSFKQLSSTEVTNIINYVNHSFLKEFKEKTILETTNDLKNCVK